MNAAPHFKVGIELLSPVGAQATTQGGAKEPES
jgi:hypothetical protein